MTWPASGKKHFKRKQKKNKMKWRVIFLTNTPSLIAEGLNHPHPTLSFLKANRLASTFLYLHRALWAGTSRHSAFIYWPLFQACYIVITECLMVWRGRALMDLTVESVVCWDFSITHRPSWMGDFNPGLCRLSARWTLLTLIYPAGRHGGKHGELGHPSL